MESGAFTRCIPTTVSYKLLPILVTLILVGSFLYWYVEKGHERYMENQWALMHQSVIGTARLISLFIQETRQKVQLFADEEIELIGALAAEPSDDDLRTRLTSKAERYFPGFFAFSVANAEGRVLIDDFDGKVERLCRRDLNTFAQEQGKQDVFIHPNPLLYHFDIMTHWQTRDGQRGIFFISFPSTILAKLLRNSQLHSHQLLLLHRDQPRLIEITGKGARIDLKREFMLSLEEEARIGDSADVDGSHWTLVDLPAAGLYMRYKTRLKTQAASIFFVFLLFSGAMYWLIHREEKHRNAAEQALHRSHDQLEARIEERTEALSAAKAEAERANEVKSRFLATTSHDLRQPLQTIALLNGVLARKVETPQMRNIVVEQHAVVTSMTGILNPLLDLCRLDAGGIKPQPTDFPVANLLDKIMAEYREPSLQKGLSLRRVLSTAAIHSDRLLLERIVENFVSNAVKYTDHGKLLVGCRRRGPNLRIEVWDTGAGIPETQHELIFDAFYQADNPARETQKGLGLGLSIAQHLANLLGHRLDVRSNPGAGSMFAVEVPLARKVAPSAKQAQTSSPATESLCGKAILLIEDDRSVLDALRFLLELLDCRVETAVNGEAAMAKIEADGIRPDLVLSDYRLPGRQDGLQLIKQIRRYLGRDLPALLLTGDTVTQIQPLLDASGIPVLHKPVDSDRLTALIRQLLRKDL